MRRAHLLIGLASAVIAAGVVVFAIDVEDIGMGSTVYCGTWLNQGEKLKIVCKKTFSCWHNKKSNNRLFKNIRFFKK